MRGPLRLTRHVDEQLGESTEGERQRSPPERDWRDETLVDANGISATVHAARVGLVRLVAKNAVSDAGKSADEESSGDTGDGTIVNARLAEGRVQAVLVSHVSNGFGFGDRLKKTHVQARA
jgi:hypothetical protein